MYLAKDKKGNKTFADITVLTKITTIDNQPNLWLLKRKFPERNVKLYVCICNVVRALDTVDIF